MKEERSAQLIIFMSDERMIINKNWGVGKMGKGKREREERVKKFKKRKSKFKFFESIILVKVNLITFNILIESFGNFCFKFCCPITRIKK